MFVSLYCNCFDSLKQVFSENLSEDEMKKFLQITLSNRFVVDFIVYYTPSPELG
jgi:hypothetical protein